MRSLGVEGSAITQTQLAPIAFEVSPACRPFILKEDRRVGAALVLCQDGERFNDGEVEAYIP